MNGKTVTLYTCQTSWLYESDEDYPGRGQYFTSIEAYQNHHGCDDPVVEVEVTYKAIHPPHRHPDHRRAAVKPSSDGNQ